MPLNFGNAGLVMQGANAAQQDTNSLETQRIGLEDLKRTHDTDEAVRQVAAAGGTHEDMALAAEKRGDYQRALQHRQAGKALEDESIKNVIHKALIDPTPGDRPDLVAAANRYRKGGGMTSMSLDDKGNLTFSGAKSGTMNVGVAAERMGLVKPFEKEVPAGAMYIRGNPATGQTTTFRNDAPMKFELKDGILYNERSGAWQQVDTKGKWTLGKITHGNQEVPVAINSDTGAVNLLGPGGVRTGLEAKVTAPTVPGGPTMISMPGGGVAEFKPSTEATPGTTHVFSANEPGKPAQPPTMTPAVMDAPPLPGARKAPDGNWYLPDPNNQGKFLQVVSSGGAAPAAAPAAAAPKPAAKPAAPKPAAPTQKADDDKLPEVAVPEAAGQSPAARHQARVAAARAEQDKARSEAPKKRAVETFRAIAESPRMTAEDAPLIKEAIATGLLTPAEKSKAEKMLAKLQPKSAGFSDGGVIQKVSRGIEMVGRAAGTERGKSIESAEKAVAPEKKATALERAKSIDEKVEAAEKGYARGGKVSRYGI